ncbi:methyl farnesoate epoxidase-like [Periplaneta americana]|uniref:methyl farnesoate epoxidase-like n=1 Tax=Periplaneta americana TaxID=6978 RepID=UPI0037E88BE1
MFYLLLAGVALLILYSWLTMKPKNFPPGPPYYPIVGSAPNFPIKFLHLHMAEKWLSQYGPLVGLMLGAKKCVAVCGPKEVLEVLRREEFQGRHQNVLIRDRAFDKKIGILFSDGPLWTEQRRFTLRHLRDFGFGKHTMEEAIVEEVEDLVTDIRKQKVVQVSGLFAISTLNVLWNMMAGVRYARDDPELRKLLADLQHFLRGGGIGRIVNLFPVVRHYDPGFLGYRKAMEGIWKMQDYMRETIRNHESTLDENSARDLIDVYLIEMRKQADNPNSTFTEEGLIVICMDIFAAGAESVGSFLGFCLLYMVLHPRVQKEVQKELDAVVGRDRRPGLQDRPQLHYVEAVLTEVSRMNPTSPLTPPHRCTKDTTMNGYNIPKDTILFISLWSLFQDREHWGDPEQFRPERFLDADGKFVRDEWMIPFGTGKRACMGEVLARNSMFLIFTALLQEFWFTLPEEDPVPPTTAMHGVVATHHPFRLVANKRQ